MIDDHPITHLGARSLLPECGFDTVLRAEDAGTALRHLDRALPDLIILDLGLPGIGGLALLPQLQSRAPEVPVLVFTMNENPAFARMAMEQSAQGFLSKNALPEQFIAAVRTIMAGRTFLEPRLALTLATGGHAEGRFGDLNAREAQVLRLIAQGQSYDEIADAIHVSYKTVANVSAALRRKLSARNLTELMRVGLEMDRSVPKQLAR